MYPYLWPRISFLEAEDWITIFHFARPPNLSEQIRSLCVVVEIAVNYNVMSLPTGSSRGVTRPAHNVGVAGPDEEKTSYILCVGMSHWETSR